MLIRNLRPFRPGSKSRLTRHVWRLTPSAMTGFKKWFVRLYIPALMLVLTGGMLFVLKFGYTPVPPMVMTPSFFDQPDQIGAVVFRRFYQPMRENKTVVFGIPIEPAFHRDVIQGFLQAAEKDGGHYDLLVVDNQMPDIVVPSTTQIVKVDSNTSTQAELVDAVMKAEASGKHTLVLLPNVYSTHILKGNPLTRLEKTLGHKLFSISTAPLALANDQEYLVDPACVGSERDNMGTSDFGCAILSAGRQFYREMAKKNYAHAAAGAAHVENQSRWVAIMNQPTQDEDYLLMISYPGQNKGNAAPNRDLRMNPPGGAGGPIR